MKKPATLCIVDMQPESFPAAADPHVACNVVDLVQEAKLAKAGIVVLEYLGSSSTHAAIKSALKGYKKVAVYKKNENDGSPEFIRACKRRKFNQDEIKVCGVYSEYCVAETTEGLSKQLPGSRIQVIAKACNGDYHEEGMEEMSQLKGVQVIR